MFKKLSLIAIVFVIFFASCEDKQTSSDKKNSISPEALLEQRKEDSIQNARDSILELRKKELAQKDQKTAIEKNDLFPIAQEQLMPTLREYGKDNRETKIRIKTAFGNIDVELYRDTPLHRANFIMLVILVTNPSRKPAIIKNGTVLITILSPSFTPIMKDFKRE